MDDRPALKLIEKMLAGRTNGLETSATDFPGIGSESSLRARDLHCFSTQRVMMLTGKEVRFVTFRHLVGFS